jgi:hypothetical protein
MHQKWTTEVPEMINFELIDVGGRHRRRALAGLAVTAEMQASKLEGQGRDDYAL